MILFEIDRVYGGSQPFLACLYQSVLLLCYYGMMHIGEVTMSPHVLRAMNVHMAKNKDKLLLILYSSKTQSQAHRPQKIKITSFRHEERNGAKWVHRHFCPFIKLRLYLRFRENYTSPQDQFFIFRDGQPLKPEHLTKVLRTMIKRIGLDPFYYSVHSLRIGRTSELIRFGVPVNEIERLGRW